MSNDTLANEFPSSELLRARRDVALPRNLPTKSGIYAARAQGVELWDVEGKRYIDFIGGIGVLNVGHNHPKVVQAIKDQADKFIHTAFGIAQYESYVALAERLNALAPGDTPKKTAFFNSGAEAVENAVKFARRITGRPGVIAFEGGFHGRTLLATALTGKAAPYKIGFGPFPPGIYHAPYPNPEKGLSSEVSLGCIRGLLKADIPADEVAAILVEPVQGEGGFNPAPNEFLKELRALCDEHGILLIADEVQTGFARTGKMFAFEHSGVEPDLLCVAKSIAGGIPLSAVIGKGELLDQIHPGGMGSTYGGNPLGCAAGLAVLDVIEEEGLVARAEVIGAKIEARMRALQEGAAKEVFGSVRRVGAMTAVECVEAGAPDKPNPALAGAIVVAARKLGLILTTAGAHGQVVRMLTPLIVSDALLDEGLKLFDEAVKTAIAGLTPPAASSRRRSPKRDLRRDSLHPTCQPTV